MGYAPSRAGDRPAPAAPDPRLLEVLRERVAKIAARAEGFSEPSSSDLGKDSAALREAVPLGRDMRFDRLLGGGLKPGTLTEIMGRRPGDAAAAAGFLLALAARLAKRADKAKAAIFWIHEDFAQCEQGGPYGPGLALYGLDPARLVLVAAPNAQQALWAMEEALKCRAPAVVIGELWSAKPYDLTASRRLVLAAQKHGTPALLALAGCPGAAETISSGADLRFEIRAVPSLRQASAGTLPLPGMASFAVRIAKARAGAAAFGIDRDRFHPLIWDHDEALFRDALPLALAPVARDRSDKKARRQG